LRSPISGDSERRAAEAQFGHSGSEDELIFAREIMQDSTILDAFEWPWKNGYGTLARDNLPSFFQPFGCYRVKMDGKGYSGNVSSLLGKYSGKVETCCLYLYDDTVALLQTDVVFEGNASTLGALLESRALDDALSECAKVIYKEVIYPEFRRYARRYERKGERALSASFNRLRDPSKLKIFRDVAFNLDSPPLSYVLWTGRYIVASPEIVNNGFGDFLCRWVSYTGPKENLLEERQMVGSGNILVLSNEPDLAEEDWFRGLSVCQLYNAILSIYGGILKSSYSMLDEYVDSPNRKTRELNTLMRDITRSLDHLEFTRLEFKEALAGVQGERSKVVAAACDAWSLPELIASALERTDLIRSKITRLLEARKTALNRSVELILTGIGGVALIDLFISLTTASRDLEADDIPGLLDAFLWLQPDGSIALSSALLIVISVYIYQAKR
jgi:hypothetical protein